MKTSHISDFLDRICHGQQTICLTIVGHTTGLNTGKAEKLHQVILKLLSFAVEELDSKLKFQRCLM